MFDEIRIQQLADNIHQDLTLLKEYEDGLRFTSEPRGKGKYEHEILQQVKATHPVPEPVMHKTLDAIRQIFSEIITNESVRFDSRLITDVTVASVDDPRLDSGHKLKVSIPIIPLILLYEGDIGLKSGLNLKKAWQKMKTRIRDTE